MKKTRRKLNKKFVITTTILLTILIISTTFLIIVKHNNKDEDIRIKIDDIKGNTYKYNIKDQYTNVTKSSITFNDDGKTIFSIFRIFLIIIVCSSTSITVNF